MKKNWVKLNLQYIGQTNKKHQIFRARKWNTDLEKILKKPVFNESYQLIGKIFDLMGPVKNPFISIKTLPNHIFNPEEKYFAKVK